LLLKLNVKVAFNPFRSVANKIDEMLETRKIGAAFTFARGVILTAMDITGAEKTTQMLSQRVETSFTRTLIDFERRLE